MPRKALLGGFATCIALTLASVVLAAGPPSTKGRWTNYGWMTDPTTHMVLARGGGDTSRVVWWDGHEVQGLSLLRRVDVPPMSAFHWANVRNVLLPQGAGSVFCAAHSHLADGKVLITGGQADAQEGAGSLAAFYYDPVTNQTSLAPSLVQPRYYPSITQLADNAVIVMGGTKFAYSIQHGGRNASGATQSSMHSLTMGSDLFWVSAEDENVVEAAQGCESAAPALEGHTILHDDLSLGNGQRRFLVFGGRYKDAQGSYVYSNDVYQVTGNYETDAHDIVWKWCKLTTLGDDQEGGARPVARWQHAAEVLSIKVYPDPGPSFGLVVFGGQDAAGNALGDVWVLELNHPTPIWRHKVPAQGESAPAPRWGHTLTHSSESELCGLLMSRLIVIGGRDEAGVRTDDAWGLDVPLKDERECQPGGDTHLWTQLPSSGTPRYNHVAMYRTTTGHSSEGWSHLGVLVHGGFGADGQPIDGNQVWAFHDKYPTSPSWPNWVVNTVSNGPQGRGGHAASYEGHASTWTMHGGQTDGSGTQLIDDGVWVLQLGGTFSWRHHSPQAHGPGALAEHVLVFDGMPAYGEQTHLIDARRPEAYDTGLPVTLPGTVTQYPTSANKQYVYYPMVHSMPDGNILLAGPESESRVFTPCASAPGWGALIPSAMYAPQGASVQYLPGKYMKCGGLEPGSVAQSRTQVLDATAGGSLAWSTATTTALRPRTFHNLVLLPTGETIATGGLVSDNPNSTLEEHWPQIWTPPSAGNPNGTWGDTLSADPLRRGYHSSAILLPDGRVVTCGDFDLSQYANPMDPARHWTVFEPPYLFGPDDQLYGARPTITSLPSFVSYGGSFSVGAGSTTGLTSACLMRPSSVTHQRNFDQLYIPLQLTITNGTTVSLVAPGDPDVAPPGDYLLFLIKTDAGRKYPSIARWVRVGYAPVPTISATAVDPTTIGVNWTAPINVACATENVHQVQYDLRASASTITSANFAVADQVPTSAPGASGVSEQALDNVACGTRRYYALKVRTGAGVWSPMSNVVNTKTNCLDCEDPPCFSTAELPTVLALRLASPTPATGAVELRLALPASARGQAVDLRILDVAGRQVIRLLSESGQPGHRSVRWSGIRGDGGRAARGVYFAHLRVGEQVLKQTIVLVE